MAINKCVNHFDIGHVVSPAITKMLMRLMNLSPDNRKVEFSYLVGDSIPCGCLDDGVVITLKRKEHMMQQLPILRLKQLLVILQD